MRIYEEITPEMIHSDLRYLELLSHNFPSIASASTEIINLEAILNLPEKDPPAVMPLPAKKLPLLHWFSLLC